MFPTKLASPLRLYAGDDFTVTLRFAEAGAPVDLSVWTDWAADWQGTGERVSFTVDTDRATEGLITLSLSGAQTRVMIGHGVWDLQAKNGDITRTWARGTTEFTEDVTRP